LKVLRGNAGTETASFNGNIADEKISHSINVTRQRFDSPSYLIQEVEHFSDQSSNTRGN
jgi:hypothetical protein